MKAYLLIGVGTLALVTAGGYGAIAHDHHGRHHGCAGCTDNDCGCPDCAFADGSRGQSRGSGAAPGYDRDTVTTLRGTATAVAMVPARGGRAGGWHLTLESEGKATEVHLGPSWFLEALALKLDKGDAVEVTGSLVEQGGTPFLIAREVKHGAKLYTLRDEGGVPAWSGGPRR